jgi:hypothetical protein
MNLFLCLIKPQTEGVWWSEGVSPRVLFEETEGESIRPFDSSLVHITDSFYNIF